LLGFTQMIGIAPMSNTTANDELRSISIEAPINNHAEGSVLYSSGLTKIHCTASISEGVPRFLRDSNKGWLTAEYGMLPRSTHTRNDREATRGKQSGRTQEIQRLIGRSLRSMINLKKLGDYTVIIDCDVLQADGGTRTASINAGCVALVQAIQSMQYQKILHTDPIIHLIGAVSVGIVKGKPTLDLNYQEDSTADTDLNIVMSEKGDLIEIQGTAEHAPFSRKELDQMLDLAYQGICTIIDKQKSVLLQPLP
jgi:ribonuclease PH